MESNLPLLPPLLPLLPLPPPLLPPLLLQGPMIIKVVIYSVCPI